MDEAERQLDTRVATTPQVVRVGEAVAIEIEAINRTKKVVHVPTSHYDGERLVMDQTGVIFDADPATQRIVRISVSTSPPVSDPIGPGQTKRYRLTWRADEDDEGSGYLIIGLPWQFDQIDPIPIRVTK